MQCFYFRSALLLALYGFVSFVSLFSCPANSVEELSMYLQTAAGNLYGKNDIRFIGAAKAFDNDNYILGYSRSDDKRLPYFERIVNIYDWRVNYNLVHNGYVHLFGVYGALEENYYHWEELDIARSSSMYFYQYQSLITLYCGALDDNYDRFLTAYYGAKRAKEWGRSFSVCRQWLDNNLHNRNFLATQFVFGSAPAVLVPEWVTDGHAVRSDRKPFISYRLNPLFYSGRPSTLYDVQTAGSLIVTGAQASNVRLKRLERKIWWQYINCSVNGENLEWQEMEASSYSDEHSTIFMRFGSNFFNNAPYLLITKDDLTYLLYHTGKSVHVWKIGGPWSYDPVIIPSTREENVFDVDNFFLDLAEIQANNSDAE